MTHSHDFRFRAFATLAALAALTLCAALRAAEAAPTPAYPPEPQVPSYSEAHNTWEQNLTAEQYLAWKADAIAAEKQRRSGTPLDMERGSKLPDSASGYDRRTDATRNMLDDAALASLEKNKAAYGPSLKQSFEPYLGGPVFITTDSWLNGFHVLFEDSFRELETRNASQLRDNLELLLASARALNADKFHNENLNFPPDRYAVALRNTQLLLGPAILLMGGSPELFDSPLRDEISAQAEKIRRADSTGLPAWLAPADATLAALDYRRCKPVGFYAGDETLAAYFRAVRWLQMVPLRGSRIAEMDTAMLIGLAGGGYSMRGDDPGVIFQRIARLIGPPDDPSPFDLIKLLDTTFPRPFSNFDFSKPNTYEISRLPRNLIDSGYYQINSDLRRKTPMRDSLTNLVVRMIPASRAPDSILFQRLMDKGIAPSGLAVAAMLHSSFAAEKLSPPAREIAENARENLWQSEKEPYRSFRRTENGLQIYDYYLRTLEALFLPPESGSPPFMQNEFWKAKSCQTALAGWAQLLHTFTLQKKNAANYLGLVMVPPGFVEPNPEFFARAGGMVDKTIAALDTGKCFQPIALLEAEKLRGAVKSLERVQADFAPTDTLETFRVKMSEKMRGADFVLWIEHLIDKHASPQTKTALHSTAPEKFREAFAQFITALKSAADACEKSSDYKNEYDSEDLRNRWETLRSLTHKLEALAHKQLRAQPWTFEEENFLKTYGERLALVMGYWGNSWLTPKDDAPRWAEAARDPQRDTALAVAVGRPRTLYVLYPWNGLEILCQGSVMQYYEYETTPAATPLTDTEWLHLLDTPAAPALPAWQRDYAPPPAPPQKRLKD